MSQENIETISRDLVENIKDVGQHITKKCNAILNNNQLSVEAIALKVSNIVNISELNFKILLENYYNSISNLVPANDCSLRTVLEQLIRKRNCVTDTSGIESNTSKNEVQSDLDKKSKLGDIKVKSDKAWDDQSSVGSGFSDPGSPINEEGPLINNSTAENKTENCVVTEPLDIKEEDIEYEIEYFGTSSSCSGFSNDSPKSKKLTEKISSKTNAEKIAVEDVLAEKTDGQVDTASRGRDSQLRAEQDNNDIWKEETILVPKSDDDSNDDFGQNKFAKNPHIIENYNTEDLLQGLDDAINQIKNSGTDTTSKHSSQDSEDIFDKMTDIIENENTLKSFSQDSNDTIDDDENIETENTDDKAQDSADINENKNTKSSESNIKVTEKEENASKSFSQGSDDVMSLSQIMENVNAEMETTSNDLPQDLDNTDDLNINTESSESIPQISENKDIEKENNIQKSLSQGLDEAIDQSKNADEFECSTQLIENDANKENKSSQGPDNTNDINTDSSETNAQIIANEIKDNAPKDLSQDSNLTNVENSGITENELENNPSKASDDVSGQNKNNETSESNSQITENQNPNKENKSSKDDITDQNTNIEGSETSSVMNDNHNMENDVLEDIQGSNEINDVIEIDDDDDDERNNPSKDCTQGSDVDQNKIIESSETSTENNTENVTSNHISQGFDDAIDQSENTEISESNCQIIEIEDDKEENSTLNGLLQGSDDVTDQNKSTEGSNLVENNDAKTEISKAKDSDNIIKNSNSNCPIIEIEDDDENNPHKSLVQDSPTNINTQESNACSSASSFTFDLPSSFSNLPDTKETSNSHISDTASSASSFSFDISNYYTVLESPKNSEVSENLPTNTHEVIGMGASSFENLKDKVNNTPPDVPQNNKQNDEPSKILPSETHSVAQNDTSNYNQRPAKPKVRKKTTAAILRDELLTLFKEVKVDETTLEEVPHSPRKRNFKDVDVIYKSLMEDDYEISESESSSSVHSDDEYGDVEDYKPVVINHSDSEDEAEPERTPDDVEIKSEIEVKSEPLTSCRYQSDHDSDYTGSPLILSYLKLRRKTARNSKELYINLRRMPEIEKMIASSDWNLRKRSSSLNIDRLCDLNTLAYKRKRDSSVTRKKVKKRKKLKGKESNSDSSLYESDSFSDFDASDDNIAENVNGLGNSINSDDEKLAQVLFNNIVDSDDESSNDERSDASDDESKKRKKKNIDGEKVNSVKKQLTFEEKEKKSWRNDPLLRGKFSSSDSDSDSSRKKVKRKKLKYYEDNDFNVLSEIDPMLTPGSDGSIVNDIFSSPSLEKKKINRRVKDKLSNSSDEFDSEPNNKFTNYKIIDKGENSPPKGRRNIRAVLTQEDLAVATQKAKLEEEKRVKRLRENSKKMESYTQYSQSTCTSTDDSLVLDVDNMNEPIIKVHPLLSRRLKAHQVDGVRFMWESCYESVERLQKHPGCGCILAHCMGLGKTFQVITLIHTLFTHSITETKHVLVVSPLSTVFNWMKEFKIACDVVKDRSNFKIYSIANKKDTVRKYDIIRTWYRTKGVLIMGYDCFERTTNSKNLEKCSIYVKKLIIESLIKPGPELIICDEGHLLRSHNALKTIALMKVATRRRIVLTGTPLQNNLNEYYHMVQFVKPNLLGTIKEYKINFVNPITNGQYDDSTPHDIRLMKKRSHVLCELLKDTVQRMEKNVLQTELPKLLDYAVFIKLTPMQCQLYEAYVQKIVTQRDFTKKTCYFHNYRVLGHVCAHPDILKVIENNKSKKNVKEVETLVLNDIEPEEYNDEPQEQQIDWWKLIYTNETSDSMPFSNCMQIMRSIIEECENVGDKVLVFAKYMAELDYIENFLQTVGTKNCPSWKPNEDYLRMDGTVLPENRGTMCDDFNNKPYPHLRVFIMSHKVGGLGLNLIAANRVILLGVNFNPSLDTQSVYRVYRIGQMKKVIVYRLISLGTMEEKLYQRSVTKLAVSSRVVDNRQITRHYKMLEHQEMYTYDFQLDQTRPVPSVPEDSLLAKLMTKFTSIFKYHEHQGLLENRPEEELNESEKNLAWEEFNKIKEPPPPVVAGFPPISNTAIPLPPPPSLVGNAWTCQEKIIQNFQDIYAAAISKQIDDDISIVENPPKQMDNGIGIRNQEATNITTNNDCVGIVNETLPASNTNNTNNNPLKPTEDNDVIEVPSSSSNRSNLVDAYVVFNKENRKNIFKRFMTKGNRKPNPMVTRPVPTSKVNSVNSNNGVIASSAKKNVATRVIDITEDDDDDVVIAGSTDESVGSFDTEVLKSLQMSGVSVKMVSKAEPKKENIRKIETITLD